MKLYISNIKFRLIKSLALFLVVFFTANSCNDLDLLPLDRVTSASFYKTTVDFDGAIFASYSAMQDLYGTSTETLGELGEFWKITLTITDDVAADDNGADGRSQDADKLLVRSTDIPYAAAYTQMYEGILRANVVLEQLGGENELTAEEKTRFDAEAKFLRAWFHFQLLKMWGTPPLVTTVLTDISNLAQPNTSQADLYTQILSDFGAAAAGLPADNAAWGGGNTGRATANAATAFIGKVQVWQKNWTEAIITFESVMGAYALLPNYEDVFAYDDENNAESIFEIQYGGPFSDDNLWVFDDTHSENFKASQGTGRGWQYDASNGAPGGKLGQWVPTQNLVDVYQQEPGDVRLSTNLYMDGDMYFTTFTSLPYDPSWSSTGYTIKKYRGERNMVPANHSNNLQADFNNERWYRFAELKLLYAEALIEIGGRDAEAAVQINDIRTRAGLGPFAGDITTAMRREKRLEMAFEPHRWFDIIRWGIGPDVVLGGTWDPKLVLFPFPQSEIDRSEGILTQNPGY